MSWGKKKTGKEAGIDDGTLRGPDRHLGAAKKKTRGGYYQRIKAKKILSAGCTRMEAQDAAANGRKTNDLPDEGKEDSGTGPSVVAGGVFG